jgi:cysteinyl-tRNA synthetase
MAKSKNNFYTVSDIEKKGYDPLALRYLYMTAHYRTFLNFTWDALVAAQNTLEELRSFVSSLPKPLKLPKPPKQSIFQQRFQEALSNDLNMPQALAVVWEVVKSGLAGEEKYALLLDFDNVLGLGLDAIQKKAVVVPGEIKQLIKKRDILRNSGKFSESDSIRKQIEEKGYLLEDTSAGTVVKKSR